MRTALHLLPNVIATEINRSAQSKKLARLNPPALEIRERQNMDRHIFIKTYKNLLIQQYLPPYCRRQLNCEDKLKRLDMILHILRIRCLAIRYLSGYCALLH